MLSGRPRREHFDKLAAQFGGRRLAWLLYRTLYWDDCYPADLKDFEHRVEAEVEVEAGETKSLPRS